jgi:hypothetical protein
VIPTNIKTLVDIANGIVTILALIAAGWWFFFSRSLAGTLQITLSLVSVAVVNNARKDIPNPTRCIVSIRIRVKNVGRTRVKKGYCLAVAKVVDIPSNSESINVINVELPDYSLWDDIFKYVIEIEPNEETYQDIAFSLNKPTFFAVGVRFKRKRKKEAWQAVAVFNADDKANVPSTADLAE